MDQAQLLSIIGSVYDKFVADVATKVEAQFLASIEAKVEKAIADVFLPDIDNRIEQQVKAKIEGLTGLDKAFITDIVRGEIEDADHPDVDVDSARSDNPVLATAHRPVRVPRPGDEVQPGCGLQRVTTVRIERECLAGEIVAGTAEPHG